MIMMFEKNDLICGNDLQLILERLHTKIAQERKKEAGYCIDDIYSSVLPAQLNKKGLTAFEFINMCRYYDSEAFPICFILRKYD